MIRPRRAEEGVRLCGAPVDHAPSGGGYAGRTAQARRRFWSELEAGRQLAEENASREGARATRAKLNRRHGAPSGRRVSRPAAHRLRSKGRVLSPRLRDNGQVLLESYRTIAEVVRNAGEITPAAEWFVDDFHIVDEGLRDVRNDRRRASTGGFPSWSKVRSPATPVCSRWHGRSSRTPTAASIPRRCAGSSAEGSGGEPSLRWQSSSETRSTPESP